MLQIGFSKKAVFAMWLECSVMQVDTHETCSVTIYNCAASLTSNVPSDMTLTFVAIMILYIDAVMTITLEVLCLLWNLQQKTASSRFH